MPSLISLVRLTPSLSITKAFLFFNNSYPCALHFLLKERNRLESPPLPPPPPLQLFSLSVSLILLLPDAATLISFLRAPRPPAPSHPLSSTRLLIYPPFLRNASPKSSLSSRRSARNVQSRESGRGFIGWGVGGGGGVGENALELQGVTVGRARGPARSNTSRCYSPLLHYPATMRPL